MKDKKKYIIIYDQLQRNSFVPIGLCGESELYNYLSNRFNRLGYSYIVGEKLISLERTNINGNFEHKMYMYGNFEEIKHFSNRSVEDIDEIMFENDIKHIKEKRRYRKYKVGGFVKNHNGMK